MGPVLMPKTACKKSRVSVPLSPEQGHEGHTREMLQEDRCSSMYSNYMHLLSCNIMYSHIVPLFLHSGN